MSTVAAGRGPRPAVITVLVVLAYIEAALAAIVGIVLLIKGTDPGFRVDVGYASSDIFTFAAVALLHAVVIAFVAYWLWRGNDLARVVTGVLACFAIAGYLFAIVRLGTPVLAQSIIGIVFWGLILWVLYGYEPSRRFFGDEDPPTLAPA